MINVTKPNPYVIPHYVDGKKGDEKNEDGSKKEVVFKYPKSKIFVGGLDFKLNNDDLK